MIVCASSDTLTLKDLPATIDRELTTPRHATAASNAKLEEVKREAMMHALQLYGGNRTAPRRMHSASPFARCSADSGLAVSNKPLAGATPVPHRPCRDSSVSHDPIVQ